MISRAQAIFLLLLAGFAALRPLVARPAHEDSGDLEYSFTVLSKTGDSIDGSKITGILDAPALNNRGEVVFTAGFLDGTGIVTPEKVLARTGDVVDGRKLTYTAYPSLNEHGQLVFLAGYGTASGLFSESKLLLSTGSEIGQQPVMNFYAGTAVNKFGKAAVAVQFGNYFPTGTGIVTWFKSAASLKAVSGDVIDGRQVEALGTPVLNDDGVLAFRADIYNPADPNDTGILTVGPSPDSSPKFLVQSGDTIDSKTLRVLGYPFAITNCGTVVVSASFDGGSGIFGFKLPSKSLRLHCLQDQSGLLVRVGDTVGGKALTQINQVSINQRGDMAFSAAFNGGQGIFTTSGLLIQTGASIAGHTLTSIQFSPAGMNDRREIVLSGQLSDGSKIVILGTPSRRDPLDFEP
jgi:hypothetical protein